MLEVLIVPVEYAERIFLTPGYADVTHVVSIGEPQGTIPRGFSELTIPKLRLEFHDINFTAPMTRSAAERAGFILASKKDVCRLIDFFEVVQSSRGASRLSESNVMALSQIPVKGYQSDKGAVFVSDGLAAPKNRVKLLIHCAAGVSRSTAAGVIFFAMQFGPGKDYQAFACMRLSAMKSPSPNKHVIRLADEILGREGKLIASTDIEWPCRVIPIEEK